MQMVAIKQVKELEAEIVRSAILKDGQRIDGRNTKQIRQIEAIVGFLPSTHGSALFTRGDTQAICTTTLGTKAAEQIGRASCRERVCQHVRFSGVAGKLQKKQPQLHIDRI